jgi:hypothetical protein
VRRRGRRPAPTLNIGGTPLVNVDHFKYLGGIIDNAGSSDRDFARRIAVGNATLCEIARLLARNVMTLKQRVALLDFSRSKRQQVGPGRGGITLSQIRTTEFCSLRSDIFGDPQRKRGLRPK